MTKCRRLGSAESAALNIGRPLQRKSDLTELCYSKAEVYYLDRTDNHYACQPETASCLSPIRGRIINLSCRQQYQLHRLLKPQVTSHQVLILCST